MLILSHAFAYEYILTISIESQYMHASCIFESGNAFPFMIQRRIYKKSYLFVFQKNVDFFNAFPHRSKKTIYIKI